MIPEVDICSDAVGNVPRIRRYFLVSPGPCYLAGHAGVIIPRVKSSEEMDE